MSAPSVLAGFHGRKVGCSVGNKSASGYQNSHIMIGCDICTLCASGMGSETHLMEIFKVSPEHLAGNTDLHATVPDERFTLEEHRELRKA